jgi:competence protein ComEC
MLEKTHGTGIARRAAMLRNLAVGAVLGAAVWPWCPVGVVPAAVGGIALGVLGGAAPTGRVARGAFLAAGLALGAGLVARVPAGPAFRGEVNLRGVVATAAEGRRADVELASARVAGGPRTAASGRVRVVFPGRPPPRGTAVLVQGEARGIDPTRLPGQALPAAEAARAGVRSEVFARDAARLGADRPSPDLSAARHAGLLRALVDGDATDIPEADVELLKRTGTWHIVSISGLHVGLGAALGYAAAWLLTRPFVLLWRTDLLRWVATAGGLAGAVGYAELADWGVPARRAVWMAGGALVVAAASRRLDAGKALALSALGVLVAQPSAVGSLGFQLSFGAMLGMIVVGPRVERLVPPDLPRLARWVAASAVASVGATLGTLPVVALEFQRLSPLSPLANLWAVPWLATLATPLAVLAATLDGTSRRVVLALADAAVDIGLAGLDAVDVTPWAPAVGSAGALALAGALLLRRREILGLAAVSGVLLWPRLPPRELVVTFFAVGQGDAALVEWPDGRTWLVDGGPPGTDLLRHLRARGLRSLDAVFLSHLHPDHYGGLVPVMEALPVALFVGEELPPGLDPVRVSEWTTRHPDLVPLPLGYRADDENDRSLVLRLRYGNRTVLMPGDAEAGEEAALLRSHGSALRADVLKLGHHGSRTSSTAAWLDAVRPAVVVASVGFESRYGHPSPEVLARCRRLLPGVAIWRTDTQGSIEVRSDGRELSVRAVGAPEPWRGR